MQHKNEFHYITYAQEIMFGSGTVSRLGEAIDRFGWRRVMLCTSPSLRRNGHIAPIETALGAKLVTTYEQVKSHVLDFQLAEALELAVEHEVETVIGLGGGSPIGMAKALSLTLEERETGQPARAAFPTDQPLIPNIAIPTTYAGSEMTPVYGVTHQLDGKTRKVTVSDAKVTPKLTIYDPVLTLNLPPAVTAATGINALAHCIEALYSITRNPLSTAAALSGIRHIRRALPRCHANGADLDARTEMMLGAHLAGASLTTAAMGLHHGLCHVLGGAVGLPHGIANSIMLPHAMRFNVDVTAMQLAFAAEAMGIAVENRPAEAAAELAVQFVYDLVAQLGLPQKLREVGVEKPDLPRLAQLALSSKAVQNNPKPITDAAQTEAVFRAAW